jgi:glycosyltransferase involved in cell wall biosynthesis
MHEQPLVSVVIPTFNRSPTITSAIDSVLAQTYKPIELIVVDDGSDDDTLERLAVYRDQITVVSQPQSGPSAARNRGVAHSNGSMIAFLDSDDIWMRGKISRQVTLMQRAGSSVDCCVCNAVIFDELDRRIGESLGQSGIRTPFAEGVWSNPQEVLATRFLLFNQVALIRRPAFDRCGGYDERLQLLEDHDMALKLACNGSWALIRDPLVVKRNGRDGIGVRCMNDRIHHNRAALEALKPWIRPDSGLCRAARRQMSRSTRELRIERFANQITTQFFPKNHRAGHMLHSIVRIWKSIRRRLPGWPQLEGYPI